VWGRLSESALRLLSIVLAVRTFFESEHPASATSHIADRFLSKHGGLVFTIEWARAFVSHLESHGFRVHVSASIRARAASSNLLLVLQ